jgi:hypothetical protein
MSDGSLFSANYLFQHFAAVMTKVRVDLFGKVIHKGVHLIALSFKNPVALVAESDSNHVRRPAAHQW